jgi:hypothetical protein
LATLDGDVKKSYDLDSLGNNSNGTVEIYYADNTDEGNFGKNKLTSTELKQVIQHAKEILGNKENNLPNLKFIPISVAKAQEYTFGTQGVCFIAFVAKEWSYGNSSRRGKNGAVAVYNFDRPDSEYKSWLTWVDVRSISISKDKFPDFIYSVGFSMAHEILHQLLYFASTLVEKKPLLFDHYNTEKNLNMDGLYSGFGTLKKGSHERIIPAQREYLTKYFDLLKQGKGFKT